MRLFVFDIALKQTFPPSNALLLPLTVIESRYSTSSTYNVRTDIIFTIREIVSTT